MCREIVCRLIRNVAAIGLAFGCVPDVAALAADPPLQLARDGFMYVAGKTMTVGGREYFYGQMYVEIRIPAKQSRPYPIIMVHGGSMSPGPTLPARPTAAKVGRNISCAKAMRSTSSISLDAHDPDS